MPTFDLPTAIVGTFIGALVLAAALAYQARLPGAHPALALWAAAHALYAARQALNLAAVLGPSWAGLAAELCFVGYAALLLAGTLRLSGRATRGGWLLGGALALGGWLGAAEALALPFVWKVLPAYLVSGSVLIATGIAFRALAREDPSVGYGIVAALFVLWGLHSYDYPFLRPVRWFAPFGFLLTQVLSLSVALGLIVTTQRRQQMLAEGARRRAEVSEARLAESEERFRDLARASADWFWEMDATLRFAWLSGGHDAAALEGVLGQTRWDAAGADPERSPEWRQHRDDLLARRPFRDFQYAIVDRQGETRVFRVSGRPMFDAAGAFRGYRGTAREVTAEVEAERRAADAQRRLAQALESVPSGFALFDAAGGLVFCNDRCRRCLEPVGHLVEARAGLATLLAGLVERGAEARTAGQAGAPLEAWLGPGPAAQEPLELRMGDHSLELRRHALHDGATLVVVTDTTEARQQEARLRKAQKMEAVGQLAGGVAHDFNNLLAVVTGYGELLLERLPVGDPRRPAAEQIVRAAERGATLTRQLLAFSRRQHLEARVLDLNALVASAHPMLQRAAGEHIAVTLRLAPGPVPVRADAGQLEQVLVNLVVNARDAMPRGGTLTLETDRAVLDAAFVARHPGSATGAHATLSVADTGSGMSAEVLAHLFEPFFTTKPPGKGTGLGLASVYGIVKQHRGAIFVESAPGRGTRVQIYLPLGAPAGDGETQAVRVVAPSPRGSETILLVEDEAEVRALARQLLERQGYRVLEAGSPRDALALADGHADPIDLLLTDVIMPGMGGRELAERMTAARSGLRVLYMSGYAADAVEGLGVASGLPLLAKPFTLAALARAVREVLDAAPPSDVIGLGRA